MSRRRAGPKTRGTAVLTEVVAIEPMGLPFRRGSIAKEAAEQAAFFTPKIRVTALPLPPIAPTGASTGSPTRAAFARVG